MEFPDLGSHCSEESCNKLDFLPVKCDGCKRIFCASHYSYSQHNCPTPGRKDFQVPICPLCGEPVPTPRGVLPDQTVGQHIDKYCKLETKKIFTNACSYANCKKKELVPITCSICRRNFCLGHRHPTDHKCDRKAPNNSPARQAAGLRRDLVNCSRTNHVQAVQGDMNDDEALARALELSMIEQDKLAELNRRGQTSDAHNHSTNITTEESKNKCHISYLMLFFFERNIDGYVIYCQ